MLNRSFKLMLIAVVSLSLTGCLGETQNSVTGETQNSVTVGTGTPNATPSRSFTAADVAKLKWIEGTWRGMDGDEPFFERYRLAVTALVVETLTDATLSKVED